MWKKTKYWYLQWKSNLYAILLFDDTVLAALYESKQRPTEEQKIEEYAFN